MITKLLQKNKKSNTHKKTNTNKKMIKIEIIQKCINNFLNLFKNI